ncbi:radical SAM protein [Candidatus Woesearchaeota archaeon]|nr:radical SAM protein [Candidatus Woesearchaeota archaeon]
MEGYIAAVTKEMFFGEKCLMVWLNGCNFNCQYCNVQDILKTKSYYKTELGNIENIIKKANDVKKIVFTGGEPLFQKAVLRYLLKKAKDNNLKTCIHTNGSKPKALKSLLEDNIIDEVYFDIKCSLENYENITKSATFFITRQQIIKDIKESLCLMKEYEDKINISFVTVIIPGLVYRKEELIKTASLINNIKCRWHIKPFTSHYGIEEANLLEGYMNKESLEEMPFVVKKIKDKYKNIEKPSLFFLKKLKKHIEDKFNNLKVYIEN